ncbi:unnamed protein product, partial [Callosobruchus maculatus]
ANVYVLQFSRDVALGSNLTPIYQLRYYFCSNMARKFLTDKELEDIILNDSDFEEGPRVSAGLEDSDSDLSDAESEHTDHDTDSEQEFSDGDNIQDNLDDAMSGDVSNQETSSSSYFYGKSRYKWSRDPPTRDRRTPAHNIVTHLPGLRGSARLTNPTTPLQAWQLLFTDEILEVILKHTNAKITELSAKYHSENVTYVNHLSMSELKAFLGLNILAGVFKSGREDADSLWATDGTGRDIFRATMTLKRFLFLLCAIRFDDPDSRADRIASGDTAAAVSEVFKSFIKNCSTNYTCSEFATVDEMLVPFRGKCKFRMYMKSKPAKYGLKIMCLCDARTHYLINAFIYTGKNVLRRNPKKLSIPTLDVLDLVSPIENTNRNITGDNWFTSNELMSELKSRGLTYVGTMRKNKRDIPPQFQPNKSRTAQSSIFGFTGDRTLVSFVPKRNRSVILLSSMHHTDLVNKESNKPEINEFYNSTKSGVDSLDQKCASYSCSRRSRRWPLTIFFAMLNISTVNSRTLYIAAKPEDKMTRKKFNVLLGKALIQEHLQERLSLNISREMKNIIRKVLGIAEQNQPDATDLQPPPAKRMRCVLCPRSKDRKTPMTCSKCRKPICKQHAQQRFVCNACTTASEMWSDGV